MNYIKERFLTELTVKKSKFIAVIYPLESKESREGILLTLKKEFPKATHYCYAYIIDSYMKSSDDGEPSQTAGKPILNIILKHNLNRCLIVVIRYFGGILLGASNLTRTYLDAANEVVKKAKIYHEENRYLYVIKVDYHLNDLFKNIVKQNKIEIEEVLYEDKVCYRISSENEVDESILKNLYYQIDIENLGKKKVLIEGEVYG